MMIAKDGRCFMDKFAVKTDKTVYKEWEDRIERAATTASSLEAEQDSGNINRTQFMATLNEPLPQGTRSGSGPRYALTVNPTVYASCVKQFWTIAKVKKVNDQEHIQALVDKHKVIITEESIIHDLKFDDAEVEGMAKHTEIYVISSHTKKVFANMRRQGQGFSRNVTLLFETMMVNAHKEVGEGSGLHTDSHYTPTDTQPSSSKSQKKIKPKRKQRQAAKVYSPGSEIPIEEIIPTLSNDPLPSAKEIAKLKKRVKKIEKRRKSRPAGLKRLKKGRMHDADMFGVDDLKGNEVIVDVREKIVEKEVSTPDPVTTAGEVLTAASVEDSVAPTIATTVDVDDELTLAKTLIAIKATKPKVISTAITTPRAKENMEECLKKTQAKVNECSSKRARQELEQESAKKQKLAEQEQAKVAEDDTTELKRCLEIVLEDDNDVAIEATPLSSKSTTIFMVMWNVRLQVDYEVEMAYDLLRLIRRQINEGYKPQ
nr:hypothetical protein [Tanacetum cinerariifolium]